MTPAEQLRADKLVALARERFDQNLSKIELQVINHSCQYDDPPDWQPSDPPDPTIGPYGRPLKDWQGPELRPQFLRWLLHDADAVALLDPRGLRVRNARLREPLDLAHCHIPLRLSFKYCLFEDALILEYSEINGLYIADTTLQSVQSAGSAFHGPVLLRRVEAAGLLDFSNTIIEGPVSLSGSTLTEEAVSLSLDGAIIKGGVFLQSSGEDRFACAGEIRMLGVDIGGSLNMNGANLSATGDTLSLDRAIIKGGVFLRNSGEDRFTCAGEIRMQGANIGSQLSMNGANLTATGDALSLDRAIIKGSVFLQSLGKDRFACAGEIRMLGVDISGQLSMSGASLTATGDALSLDGGSIKGGVFLQSSAEGRFTCAGKIRMQGANIGSQLSMNGATLTTTGTALSLDGAIIKGGVFLQSSGEDRFTCAGVIRMPGVNIGGQLGMNGAQFASTDLAVSLFRANIDADMFLEDGFSCAGNISLLGATIGGNFYCRDASITYLDCESMAAENLYWSGRKEPENESLDLTFAKIKTLYLDAASMEKSHEIRLNGLDLQAIRLPREVSPNVEQCISLLRRQPSHHSTEPQPWMLMSRLLEASGDRRGARRIIYEFRKRQAAIRSPLARPLFRLFSWLEEQPFRILVPLSLCLLLGFSVFHSYRAHFAETSETAYAATHTPGPHQASASYERLNTLIYTLENSLPVVKLGQDEHWAPHPDPASSSQRLYWFLVSIRWFLILAGWAMGIILGAAVGSRFRT